MRRLSELPGIDLIWHQAPAHAREYELRLENGVRVAALRWLKPVGTLAEGATANGSWTLKRVGALVPRVTVRVAGADQDQIRFRPQLAMLGPTTFADASGFRWTADFLATEWRFLSPAGAPLMRLGRSPSARLEGLLQMQPGAAELAALDCYVLVGWYLFVLLTHELADPAWRPPGA